MTMTAALMVTSCSSDDVQDWPTPVTKTIPYTVTVRQGTRATVDEDLSTLRFAEGDKLSISGTNISGVLDMTSGVGETTATFSGNLTYTGAGDPADDLSLTATLVSTQQSGTELTYPTDAYCSTVNEAVQKYSKLTGTGTYGAKSFALSQGTAFLNFKITFDYGVTSGTTLLAVVTNDGTELSRANVTTTTENGKVVAKFVLPIAKDTQLSNAMVMMGINGAFIADKTLAGKVYNVNKTIGAFTINASGDKVLFAPGNLQATYKDGNWTWAFAANQWGYIGANSGNTKVTATSPFISENATVDLFYWVGESSSAEGVDRFGIGIGYLTGNVNGEAMKAEWNSSNLNITNGGSYRWRTPARDEFEYVFKTRMVTVGGESKASYGLGNVNGVNGIVVLPDGWDGCVHGGFTYGNTYPNSKWSNVFSTTTTPTWAQMECAGCVFLPAAGYHSINSSDVYGAGEGGWYWTKTSPVQGQTRGLFIDPWSVNANYGSDRRYGYSVRLVRPALVGYP